MPQLHNVITISKHFDGPTNRITRITPQGAENGGKRPLLNGKFTFLAGFLDQSFWPDGQYTAPTDDALAFDIEVSESCKGGCALKLSHSNRLKPNITKIHQTHNQNPLSPQAVPMFGLNMIRLHQKVNPERW